MKEILLHAIRAGCYDIESQIMSKRVQDNVREARRQEAAESEYKRFKRSKGIKDEMIVIDTDDIAAAIKRQRVAQGNLDESVVVDGEALLSERDKCDSLERRFLR